MSGPIGIPALGDNAEIESSNGQVVAGAYPDCGGALLCLNLVPGHDRDGVMPPMIALNSSTRGRP